ncbi:hypothetical protein V5O48_013903, partial [Marasmius crinis-equi]
MDHEELQGTHTPMKPLFIIQYYFAGAIAVMVQMFYCWRIYRISKSVVIPVLLAASGWPSFLLINVSSTVILVRKFGFQDLPDRKEVGFDGSNVDHHHLFGSVVRHCDIGSDDTLLAALEERDKKVHEYDQPHDPIHVHYRDSREYMCRDVADMCKRIALIREIYHLISEIIRRNTPCGRFYTNSLLISLNGRQYIVDGAFPRVGFNLPRNQLRQGR